MGLVRRPNPGRKMVKPDSPVFEYHGVSFKSSYIAILQAAMKRKLNSVWYIEKILKYSRALTVESGTSIRMNYAAELTDSIENKQRFASTVLQSVIRRLMRVKRYSSNSTARGNYGNLKNVKLQHGSLGSKGQSENQRLSSSSSIIYLNERDDNESNLSISESFFAVGNSPQPTVRSSRAGLRNARELTVSMRTVTPEMQIGLDFINSSIVLPHVSQTPIIHEPRTRNDARPSDPVPGNLHATHSLAQEQSERRASWLREAAASQDSDVMLTSIALLTLSRELHGCGFDEDAGEYLEHGLRALCRLEGQRQGFDLPGALRDCIQSSCLDNQAQWRRLRKRLDPVLPSPERRAAANTTNTAVNSDHREAQRGPLPPPQQPARGSAGRRTGLLFRTLADTDSEEGPGPPVLSTAAREALRQLPPAYAAGLARRRLPDSATAPGGAGASIGFGVVTADSDGRRRAAPNLNQRADSPSRTPLRRALLDLADGSWRAAGMGSLPPASLADSRPSSAATRTQWRQFEQGGQDPDGLRWGRTLSESSTAGVGSGEMASTSTWAPAVAGGPAAAGFLVDLERRIRLLEDSDRPPSAQLLPGWSPDSDDARLAQTASRGDDLVHRGQWRWSPKSAPTSMWPRLGADAESDTIPAVLARAGVASGLGPAPLSAARVGEPEAWHSQAASSLAGAAVSGLGAGSRLSDILC